MVRALIALLAGIALGFSAPVLGHGGGLNRCGCHFDRKLGNCHCHKELGCGCSCEPARCGTGGALAEGDSGVPPPSVCAISLAELK
jgi:hypothetical protein